MGEVTEGIDGSGTGCLVVLSRAAHRKVKDCWLPWIAEQARLPWGFIPNQSADENLRRKEEGTFREGL